jgi:predicted HicB family RNase H-like nuclease
MAQASKTMYLRIDPEVYDKVKEQAKKDGKTMSAIVVQLLRDYLSKREAS